MVLARPGTEDAEAVKDLLIGAVAKMPENLMKTPTWDQGTEMARHAAFTLGTSVDVCFAHPNSPWERGTDENTDGLIREYFPKGEVITSDQQYPDTVTRELDNRPRRIHGHRTPAEVFNELLTSSIASTM